jgi:hypothetical protein
VRVFRLQRNHLKGPGAHPGWGQVGAPKRFFFTAVLVWSLTATPLLAQTGTSLGRPDLTQGGGIVQTGWALAPRQNPAGTVAHLGMMFQGYLYGTSSATLYGDAGFASANGKWGLNLSAYGAQGAASGSTGPTSLGSGMNYGFAFLVRPLLLAIGVGGSTSFSPTFGSSNFNIGLLFNPHGRLRIGFVLPTILAADQVPSAGVSLSFARLLHAAFESSFNLGTQSLMLAPSFMVGMREFGLSVCYGVTPFGTADASPLLREGLSAGVHFRINALRVTLAYRQPRDAEVFAQLGVILGGRD